EPVAPAPKREGPEGPFTWFAETPAAWALTGVGVVGVGVGVTMALVAKHDYDQANDYAAQILDQWTKVQDGGKTDKQIAGGADHPCTAVATPAIANKLRGTMRLEAYQEACDTYLSKAHAGDSAKTVA